MIFRSVVARQLAIGLVGASVAGGGAAALAASGDPHPAPASAEPSGPVDVAVDADPATESPASTIVTPEPTATK